MTSQYPQSGISWVAIPSGVRNRKLALSVWISPRLMGPLSDPDTKAVHQLLQEQFSDWPAALRKWHALNAFEQRDPFRVRFYPFDADSDKWANEKGSNPNFQPYKTSAVDVVARLDDMAPWEDPKLDWSQAWRRFFTGRGPMCEVMNLDGGAALPMTPRLTP